MKKRAEIKTRSDRGDTALQLAADNGHERVVSELLTSDEAEIDGQRDVDNYTPLMGAAAFGHVRSPAAEPASPSHGRARPRC